MTTNEPPTFRLIRLLLSSTISPSTFIPSAPLTFLAGPLHHRLCFPPPADMVPRRLMPASFHRHFTVISDVQAVIITHAHRPVVRHLQRLVVAYRDAPVVRHRDTLVGPLLSGPDLNRLPFTTVIFWSFPMVSVWSCFTSVVRSLSTSVSMFFWAWIYTCSLLVASSNRSSLNPLPL